MHFFISLLFIIVRFVSVLNVRFASKKTGGSTRNRKGHARPKHRGIHYQDGAYVQPGTMLITQNKLRCHPGLNVSSFYINNFCLVLIFSANKLIHPNHIKAAVQVYCKNEFKV